MAEKKDQWPTTCSSCGPGSSGRQACVRSRGPGVGSLLGLPRAARRNNRFSRSILRSRRDGIAAALRYAAEALKGEHAWELRVTAEAARCPPPDGREDRARPHEGLRARGCDLRTAAAGQLRWAGQAQIASTRQNQAASASPASSPSAAGPSARPGRLWEWSAAPRNISAALVLGLLAVAHVHCGRNRGSWQSPNGSRYSPRSHATAPQWYHSLEGARRQCCATVT